jgi:hypothetical protein
MRQRLLLGPILAALGPAAVLLGALAPCAAVAADKKENAGFVSIDTLTAMVTGPGGRRQIMTVQSGVDVPNNPPLHDYVDKITPRLRAAFAQTLQTYAGGLAPGVPPDADYIARRLQADTDRLAGKPGAKLLIGGIMIN